METRAQAATEFVVMTGFITLIILTFSVFVYLSTTQRFEYLSLQDASKMARRIAELANEINLQANGSAKTIKVLMPLNVKNITIGGPSEHEIIMTIETSTGINDVVAPTIPKVIDGTPRLGKTTKPGIYYVMVRKSDEAVVIERAT